jgi:peptidyl-prolyl cis-trans isomerase C
MMFMKNIQLFRPGRKSPMRMLALLPLAGLAAIHAACGMPGSGKELKVLAVVNGSAITEADLEKEIEFLPAYVRPIVETPAGRAQFLESLVTRNLLMDEALRRGVDRRPEVQDRLRAVRRSLILEELLQEVAEKAPGLSDEALRAYYEANPEEFQTGERIEVSHLLFKSKARADAMAARARSGETFEALRNETVIARGESSADLGFIERGRFVKEFEDAAFRAEARSVVGPIRSTYGHHIIWVGEKRPEGVQPFEEVKGKILAERREQAQQEAFETLVADLKDRAEIRILAVSLPEAPGIPAHLLPVLEPDEAPGTPAEAPQGR